MAGESMTVCSMLNHRGTVGMFAGSTVFTWVKSMRFSRRYSEAGSNNHILDVYGPMKSNHGRFRDGVFAAIGGVKNRKVLLDGR